MFLGDCPPAADPGDEDNDDRYSAGAKCDLLS